MKVFNHLGVEAMKVPSNKAMPKDASELDADIRAGERVGKSPRVQ